jgi:hypothetical protein
MANKVLSQFIASVVVDKHRIIEEHIKLVVRDKPHYMPEKVWHKMLKMCLRIESEQL